MRLIINDDPSEKARYLSRLNYGRKQAFKRGQWSILKPLIIILVMAFLLALTIKKINL